MKECILNSDPKSCELDPIPSKLLIECLDSILSSLTDLFNSSLASGIFPQCYIVDDLTQQDLRVKRKWLPNIKSLYEKGTKLRFSAGKWRTMQGIPYLLDKNNITVID